MPMHEWIHKYPQVQALLSKPDDELHYSIDPLSTPETACESCHTTDIAQLHDVDFDNPLELEESDSDSQDTEDFAAHLEFPRDLHLLCDVHIFCQHCIDAFVLSGDLDFSPDTHR